MTPRTEALVGEVTAVLATAIRVLGVGAAIAVALLLGVVGASGWYVSRGASAWGCGCLALFGLGAGLYVLLWEIVPRCECGAIRLRTDSICRGCLLTLARTAGGRTI